MTPMFIDNRAVAFYFVFFLIINNIFIYKVVIGIIRVNYKRILTSIAKHALKDGKIKKYSLIYLSFNSKIK